MSDNYVLKLPFSHQLLCKFGDRLLNFSKPQYGEEMVTPIQRNGLNEIMYVEHSVPCLESRAMHAQMHI